MIYNKLITKTNFQVIPEIFEARKKLSGISFFEQIKIPALAGITLRETMCTFIAQTIMRNNIRGVFFFTLS